MPKPLARTKMIGPIREMTREDMAATLKPCYKPVVTAGRLRDSHHRVARLAAAGLRKFEIVERTGYSMTRICQLLAAPAMIDLIAKYRDKVDAAFERPQDEFFNLASTNMIRAERMIADKLEKAEEEGTEIPVKDLVLVARDAADRFGYGKKQTNVNVNADFAAELEKAIARSGKVIEVAPQDGKLRRRA
jgi:hypothetical protein